MLFTLENRKYFECSKEEREALLPLIKSICEFAKIARSQGLLAIEDKLEGVEDDFLRYALLLVVDACDYDMVEKQLEIKAVASQKTGVDLLRMIIITDCVLMLQNGINPRLIEERAVLFLGDDIGREDNHADW